MSDSAEITQESTGNVCVVSPEKQLDVWMAKSDADQ